MRVKDTGMYFGALPIAAVSLLPQSHLRVLVAISSFQGTLESWTGGIDKILVRVNGFEIKDGKKPRELKYRRVSQIIRDLKTWGWLEVERSGFSRPNSYSIRIPENLIFRPEHSYTVSLSSEERETEKKASKKSESVSHLKSANMNRASRNATLYKEPCKETSKELTQTEKEKQVPRPAQLAFIPPLTDALSKFKERIRKTNLSPSTLESILGASSIEELSEHHKRYFDSFYLKEYGFKPADRFGTGLSKAAV